MRKRQQIEELMQEVEGLQAYARSLEAERDALSAKLQEFSETPAVKDGLLSVKAVSKARELLLITKQHAEKLHMEAETLLEDAKERAIEIVDKANAEAESILREASSEAEATLSHAKEEALEIRKATEGEYAKRQKVIQGAAAFLVAQNGSYAADMRRQSHAFLQAMRDTMTTVLEEDTPPAECEKVFATALSDALVTPDEPVDSPVVQEIEPGSMTSGIVRMDNLAVFHALGDYGFRNNPLLTDVTLPDGVETLPRSFFFGCAGLQKAVLPDTLSVIGDYAFFGCTGLVTLALPLELEHIGSYAFSCCDNLSCMRIPGGVKTIGVAAFRNSAALAELFLQKDGCLREIGSHAFQDCASLSSVTLPRELRALTTSMFYGCAGLTEMDIPKGVERMEADVFFGCTALREVRFHNENLLLQPGATAGMEHVRMTLSGKAFRWQAVTEPTRLGDLAEWTEELLPWADAPLSDGKKTWEDVAVQAPDSPKADDPALSSPGGEAAKEG